MPKSAKYFPIFADSLLLQIKTVFPFPESYIKPLFAFIHTSVDGFSDSSLGFNGDRRARRQQRRRRVAEQFFFARVFFQKQFAFQLLLQSLVLQLLRAFDFIKIAFIVWGRALLFALTSTVTKCMLGQSALLLTKFWETIVCPTFVTHL